MVRLDILINAEKVEMLWHDLTHRDNAQDVAVDIVEKLREIIPRQILILQSKRQLAIQIIARKANELRTS